MNQKKTNILAVLFLSVLVLILAGLLIFSGIKYHKMSDRLKASQEELEKVQQLAEQREEAASQEEDTTAETEEEQGILEDQQEEVSKEKDIRDSDGHSCGKKDQPSFCEYGKPRAVFHVQ